MNVAELERKLFTHTESEEWHLKHPGKLSARYQTIQQVEKNGQKLYRFAFENVLKNNNISVAKQSRFTRIPLHIHSVIEMNYVYEGESTQIIDGKKYVLHQGDVCLLNTNVAHESMPLGERDIVLTIEMRKAYFSVGFFSRLSSQGVVASFLANAISENTEKKQCMIFRGGKQLHMLMQQLSCEYFDKQLGSAEIIDAYMVIIFSELMRMYRDNAVGNEGGTELISMLQYIENHDRTITLEAMAQRFSFHPTYLSTYLRKNTGKTFKELVIAQRMFHACFYLANSEMPIYEIAQEIGYNNLGFFYKRFQEIYQMTPQEYRERSGKK